MARVTAPQQGIKMAQVSPHKRTPGKRDVCTGWTAGAARRCRDFLMTIDTDRLPPDEIGMALSLTVKDCPLDSDDWSRRRKLLIQRMQRLGATRHHWVTEWQQRGHPHLHLFAFFDLHLAKRVSPFTADADPSDPLIRDELVQHVTKGLSVALTDAWLTLCADLRAGPRSQHVVALYGLRGWMQYVAKHSARGAEHYQRQRHALPQGWQKSGRLWGKGGHWPTVELVYDVDDRTWFRMRRAKRGLMRATARTQLAKGLAFGNVAQARSARRQLAFRGHHGHGDTSADKARSSRLRGVSVFLNPGQARQLLLWAMDHPFARVTVDRLVIDGVETDPAHAPPGLSVPCTPCGRARG